MLRKGYKEFCVILCGEDEQEYSQLQISRGGQILEGLAHEKEWGIEKKVRLPLFDIDKLEKKLIVIMDDYLKTGQPVIWMFDRFKTLRTADFKFFIPFIQRVITEVMRGKLKLYEYETRTYIHQDSTTNDWMQLLTAHYIAEVTKLTLIKEYKGRKLERFFDSIDWDNDVFLAHGTLVLEAHGEFFNSQGSWFQNLSDDFGGIDGMYKYFRARDNRIKKIIVKPRTQRKWSVSFSIHPLMTTIDILEKKFGMQFEFQSSKK